MSPSPFFAPPPAPKTSAISSAREAADAPRPRPDPELRLPVGRFEYVDVTFTAADTDTDIGHTLKPSRPDNVRWIVVSRDADVGVYRDSSASALPWQPTYIWLRATAAATARLLLFIEPNEV